MQVTQVQVRLSIVAPFLLLRETKAANDCACLRGLRQAPGCLGTPPCRLGFHVVYSPLLPYSLSVEIHPYPEKR